MLVVPYTSLNVWMSPAYSGRLVLANGMAPASRRRATGHASSLGTNVASSGAPLVVMHPSVWNESLIVMGTPWSGPTLVATDERVVGFGGGAAGPLEIPLDDGVDGLVELFDPVHQMLQHLRRRHLAPPDGRRQLGRRHPVQFALSHAPTVRHRRAHRALRNDREVARRATHVSHRVGVATGAWHGATSTMRDRCSSQSSIQ